MFEDTRLGYERLEEIVFDTLRKQGEDIDALVAVQKEIHPGQDEAYWREEVVANTVPVILTDRQTGKEFALRFANEDKATRNVFEKILDAIRGFLQKAYDVLRQEKSWKQMESIKSDIDALVEIREAYFDALEEIAGTEAGAGEARFSIKEFEDGSKYVEVDTDQNIFSNATLREMPRIARNYIIKSFAGRVIGAANRAFVNRRTAEEYAFPANQRLTEDVKISKLRASTELENLLEASIFVSHEDDDGRHPEVIGGWDKYKTVFKVADRYFEGIVNIKNIRRGRLLHDVTKIKDITDRTSDMNGVIPNDASVDDTSDRNVSQKDGPVNTSIRETERDDTPRFSMKDSEGRELTPEQAEFFKDSKIRDENGNLLVVYHGTNAKFNIFRRGDIGYHFGTKSQARVFAGHGKKAVMMPVYLNIKNPLIIDRDYGSWDGGMIAEKLIEEGFFKDEEDIALLKKITKMGEYDSNVYMRKFLKDRGYDGIKYQNQFEGRANAKEQSSYIAFSPEQIKRIDNRTPTSSRDVRFSLKDPVDPMYSKLQRVLDEYNGIKSPPMVC